jgi:hypothetical protein
VCGHVMTCPDRKQKTSMFGCGRSRRPVSERMEVPRLEVTDPRRTGFVATHPGSDAVPRSRLDPAGRRPRHRSPPSGVGAAMQAGLPCGAYRSNDSW